MKLLFDFYPYLLFFIVYKFYGIYAATAVAMIASLIQLAVNRVKNHRFESIHIITFFTILILGGATLIFRNEIFIKWKPTIVNWLLAVLFLGSSLFGEKPIFQRLMDNNVQLPVAIWKKLNMSWTVFFIFLGCANLFVAYRYSTNVWVNFKVFGMLGLTLVFVIFQSLYMAKYIDIKTIEK